MPPPSVILRGLGISGHGITRLCYHFPICKGTNLMETRTRFLRLPLHVTISTLFIILIVVLGGLLVWQSHQKTSEIILASAGKLFDEMAEVTHLDFNATYAPAVKVLDLMAFSPLTQTRVLAERLPFLPQLVIALGEDSAFSGIQLGFPDGGYFILRPLSSPRLRVRLAAPSTASFVVDDIATDGQGRRLLTRLFYSDDLQLVERADPIETRFDPRRRPWFELAEVRPKATRPYVFYFSGKAGVTLARVARAEGVVVAVDITLERLSQTLAGRVMTPSSEVAIVTGDGHVLAYHDPDRVVRQGEAGQLRLSRVEELGSRALVEMVRLLDEQDLSGVSTFNLQQRRWVGRIEPIAEDSGLDLRLLMLSPVDELLNRALAIRTLLLQLTGGIVLVAIPIVWFIARRISRPLQQLAREADRIRRFEFQTSNDTRSFIREVDRLASAMKMMKQTINQFVALINSLAGEKDFDTLLDMITRETLVVGQADAAVVYLLDPNDTRLEPSAVHTGEAGQARKLDGVSLKASSPLLKALNRDRPTVFQDEDDEYLSQLTGLVGTSGGRVVCFPLQNRQGQELGILVLIYARADMSARDHEARIAFVQVLSGFSAVSIESRQLLKMQEDLLHAFIQVLAGAIDAKSPYTGGHCQRVPELTRRLAEAACRSEDPPFASFSLTQEQWEALHIASWLHDCGKVTTPEYVVDKATKLETLYDRIHEIRMRFEVLKRDATIRYWQRLAEGGERETLQRELDQELRRLDDDFAFIARCNEGGECMESNHLARLRAIAKRTWVRTLDDRIGISWEEKKRKERTPVSPLPVVEPLLADKPEHLMERTENAILAEDNPWGFRLDVPQYEYNRGELHNLEVARGTLTAEERYKINEHIVQTIVMLTRLPFPRHLREVPDIAGSHHETMLGTGYPRRLKREDMPLTARMMAIADIFEALTASDRPYKQPKTLSEAIRILASMRDDGHIDPDLFRLFLESEIWREYGEKFLDPAQLDEVEIERYV